MQTLHCKAWSVILNVTLNKILQTQKSEIPELNKTHYSRTQSCVALQLSRSPLQAVAVAISSSPYGSTSSTTTVLRLRELAQDFGTAIETECNV
jgi:hypothetical protein